MSQRVVFTVASILITSTISITFWFASESEGQTRRRPSRSAIAKKAKAVDNVREAYGTLVQMMKAKKYKEVAGRIYNSTNDEEHAHSHDDHGHHDHDHEDVVDIEKLLKTSPKEASRMAMVLALFEDAATHSSADGNAAVMVVAPPKDLQKYQPEKKATAIEDSSNGLGSDLKKAIGSALELLEEGDLEEFVASVFPESELKRIQKNNRKKHLVKRLTDYPALVQFMKADLKQLASLKPKMENDDSVAVFQLPGDPNLGNAVRGSQFNFKKMPDPPTRTIKFELQNGNWRFFDGGKKIDAEIQRLEYGIPSSGKLQMKWRLTNNGWKVERMPFFKLQ